MKISNYEAIKFIKQLTSEKQELINNELRNCSVSYSADEDVPVVDYNFEHTRKAIADIDEKVGKLKYALAKNNTTILLPEFNITIGEGLVKMAQLQEELKQISRLAAADNHNATYNAATGTMRYTDTTYDVEIAKAKKKEVYELIVKLQAAIDKMNITYEFEIDM